MATAVHGNDQQMGNRIGRTDGRANGFAMPLPGASLMLSFRPVGRKVLVLGTRRLAASRLVSILEADAVPVIVGVDCASTSDGAADLSDASEELRWRVEQGQCQFLARPEHDSEHAWAQLIDEIDSIDRSLFAVCITDTLHAGDEDVDQHGGATGNTSSSVALLSPVARAKLLVDVCRSRRIPVNVADRPALCDFSFPASHRFPATSLSTPDGATPEQDGSHTFASALQIAITTNGKGCRLASRIRREIVASLPRNVGNAVERVGTMREMAKRRLARSTPTAKSGSARDPSLRRLAFTGVQPSQTTGEADAVVVEDIEEEDLTFDSTPINSPVPQLSSPNGQEAEDYIIGKQGHDAPAAAAARLQRREEALAEERKRRMRWVAQMSEYWPIEYLGSLTSADMARALETYKDEGREAHLTSTRHSQDDESQRGRHKDRAWSEQAMVEPTRRTSSQHNLTLRRPSLAGQGRGHIFLVGSGTGHPGLLTAMAHRLLTSSDTDVVLSDKLVPSSILGLIPKQTPLHIARKFPGNAEGAQSELIALALEAAQQGKRVIRLKQGDPFVYGRGGEEVLAFSKAGVRTTVVPGISSALAAPLLLGIPVTQRGAADSMTLCTGVGRGGKSVRLPGYERSRSLIVLMGVARLGDVVKTLCHGWHSSVPHETSSAGTQQSDSLPIGTRIGMPFPPYTPIAIVERASSTDQRLVASTLAGIGHALTQCGEQRPPGMMLIGWAAMALDGGPDGNVDVLDDETACANDEQELERRDRARVSRWLGSKGYRMREGLDEAYRRELGSTSSDLPVTPQAPDVQDGQPDLPFTSTRGPSGWAIPRYGLQGVPRGGWGEGEEALATFDSSKNQEQ